jgi:GH25 family lysozyme M1 (1,4-beta-N-acetylmuramidase)
MSSNGIDVSSYQAGLKLAGMTGLDFVLAKATEGVDLTDSTYYYFASQAAALKVNFGAYHFFHAEDLTARRQANWFMTYAKPQSGRSLWVDYETYGANAQTDAEEIGYFIAEIKISYPHQKVGIYADETGLKRILPYLLEIPFNGFWYANPSVPMTEQSTTPEWQIHQYETLDNLDRDYSTWTPQEFGAYWEW